MISHNRYDLSSLPIYNWEYYYYSRNTYDEDHKRRLYLAIQKKNIKEKLLYFLCNRHKK